MAKANRFRSSFVVVLLGAFILATPTSAQADSAPDSVETQAAQACLDFLESTGNGDIGFIAGLACGTAEAVGGAPGVASCTAMLTGAGVSAGVAAGACTLGAAPEG